MYLCLKLTKQLNHLDKNINTEEKILQAAIKIFMRDGYDGARMQEIADEAGMNKALIHYYFKSKEKLFEKIFLEKRNDFLPRINALFFSVELSFIEKMELYVENYMMLLLKNPYLPKFLACNAHKHPNFMDMLPSEFVQGLLTYFELEITSGRIRKVDPRQFMISVLGMCIFPFAFRNVMSHIMQMGEEDFERLIQARSAEVKQYVRCILTP